MDVNVLQATAAAAEAEAEAEANVDDDDDGDHNTKSTATTTHTLPRPTPGLIFFLLFFRVRPPARQPRSSVPRTHAMGEYMLYVCTYVRTYIAKIKKKIVA